MQRIRIIHIGLMAVCVKADIITRDIVESGI